MKMNLLICNLFKDIVIYGAGDILLKVISFITIPIYTRIFTPTDYGVWSFVSTTVGLLNAILILGGDSAYARFFFEAKTLREKQLLTSTWFIFLILWSGGVIMLSLPFTKLFSQWSFGTDQYKILFAFSLLAAPIGLINTMCGQVLRNQFHAKLFTALNILSALLSIGLSLLGAVILDLGLIGMLGGALLAAGLMLPIRLGTARFMLRPMFSVRVLRDLIAFGIPLVPTSLAYWVFASSDRLVLGKLSTLDQLGLYAVANGATSILNLVNGALGQAWTPYVVRIYEEQPKLAPVLFGQVATYILVGFGLLCVGMTIFAHEMLMILSTPTFYPAAFAIGPLALGFVAYASTQVTAIGISLTKKTKYFTIFSWIAALLNLFLNVLLVPNWGMVAASWTTMASYTFLTVTYLITSQRLQPISYEKWRAVVVICLTVTFTTVVPFLPEMTLVANLVFKSFYCLIYVGLLFALGVLGKREWGTLSSLLRQRIAVADTANR